MVTRIPQWSPEQHVLFATVSVHYDITLMNSLSEEDLSNVSLPVLGLPLVCLLKLWNYCDSHLGRMWMDDSYNS